MLLIWLGALFILGGVIFMATQPIWRGRLSEARRIRTPSAVPSKTVEPHTLEPRRPGAGFGLKRNWPGLLLIVLGGMLLLAGAGYYYGGMPSQGPQ
jgi:hypothetical protein